jgi:hypothetical protein
MVRGTGSSKSICALHQMLVCKSVDNSIDARCGILVDVDVHRSGYTLTRKSGRPGGGEDTHLRQVILTFFKELQSSHTLWWHTTFSNNLSSHYLCFSFRPMVVNFSSDAYVLAFGAVIAGLYLFRDQIIAQQPRSFEFASTPAAKAAETGDGRDFVAKMKAGVSLFFFFPSRSISFGKDDARSLSEKTPGHFLRLSNGNCRGIRDSSSQGGQVQVRSRFPRLRPRGIRFREPRSGTDRLRRLFRHGYLRRRRTDRQRCPAHVKYVRRIVHV